MDVRVSFSGWSPIDRLRRSAVARVLAVVPSPAPQAPLDKRPPK